MLYIASPEGGMNESPSFCTWLLKIKKNKTYQKKRQTKHLCESFPGDSVVKNLPVNTGDTGLIPSPGRSHMPRMGQLSPRATTTEPARPGARAPK